MADEKTEAGGTDMQEAMEVYHKLATPGPEHALLTRLAGTWDATMKSWMDPAQPPMVSTGSSEQQMVLGGRFLRQEYTGEMMGGAPGALPGRPPEFDIYGSRPVNSKL